MDVLLTRADLREHGIRMWTGVQKEPRSGVIGVQSGPLILMV